MTVQEKGVQAGIRSLSERIDNDNPGNPKTVVWTGLELAGKRPLVINCVLFTINPPTGVEISCNLSPGNLVVLVVNIHLALSILNATYLVAVP